MLFCDFDVVVCDGFDGNVLLKGIEGTAGAMMTLLRQNLKLSLRTKLGAALAMPAFRRSSMRWTIPSRRCAAAGREGRRHQGARELQCEAFSNALLQPNGSCWAM